MICATMPSRLSRALLVVTVFALTLFSSAHLQARPSAPSGKTYELRIYTANAGRLADLNVFFKNSGMRVLAKHGIENVFDGTVLEGAPVDGADAANMLVCVLAHPNPTAADAAWGAVENDAEWKSAWARLEQGGAPLAKPVTVIRMTTTDFSPALEAPGAAAGRVFELRKYNTGADGLPRTIDQFKSGLAAIIAKNGMTPIAYWTANDSSAFIYLVAHKDREAGRASWSTFTNDYRPFMAEFNARVGAPPPGRRVDDNRFLTPTDYSPRK